MPSISDLKNLFPTKLHAVIFVGYMALFINQGKKRSCLTVMETLASKFSSFITILFNLMRFPSTALTEITLDLLFITRKSIGIMYSFMQSRSSSGEQSDSKTASSSSLAGSTSSSAQLANWMKDLQEYKVDRNEMNKLVMNYLVQEGFKEAAERFRSESGVEPGPQLDLLDDRIKIREAVQSGQIDEAVVMTNDLNPDILDSKSHLFFHLQQQKLIELIREKKTEEALTFAQNIMAELGTENTDYLEELEKTMALLAYEDPETSPFGHLLKTSQRHMVASEVNAAILETQHQETMPKLASVLKLLLWTQNELDRKHVKYPKMSDIAEGTITMSNEEKVSTITIT